jgi:aminoglycoside phosphotransferase
MSNNKMTNDDLDPRAIIQDLNWPSAISIDLVQGGSDTAIWRVFYPHKSYALRVFRSGQQNVCEREVAVMRVASAGGIPAPQIHATGTWREHPVLLLSWLPGKPLSDELFAHPWKAWQLGRLSGQMQAEIHKLTAPDLLREASGSWIDWKVAHEEDLQQRLRSLHLRSNALLHLDYHFLNVLTDGQTITGVLDWTNAHAGDPRADIARTYSIVQVDIVGSISALEMIVRRIFEQGWRRGYEEKAGQQRDLSLFNAWAGAVMEKDLEHKRGPVDMARIHRWTTKWKERAGCQ